MIIFKHTTDIRSYLQSKNAGTITIGFVPTMGALHNGHIGLVTKAREESLLVICSIFVNPTQFNDPNDFEKYPSTIEKDIYQLERAGCDVLFLPSVKDLYPDGIEPTRNYKLGVLETILEGEFRPGHFQGVCQVVHRLLNIVMPGKLFLGQKDYQQCMVIRKLVELVGIETQIIICPTLREPDGLAMSSRNLRLSEAERKNAPKIFEALLFIKNNIKGGNIPYLKEKAKQLLILNGFKVDYVEIAEAGNLHITKYFDEKKTFIALAAVYLNEVRLIDNIILNEIA